MSFNDSELKEIQKHYTGDKTTDKIDSCHNVVLIHRFRKLKCRAGVNTMYTGYYLHYLVVNTSPSVMMNTTLN